MVGMGLAVRGALGAKGAAARRGVPEWAWALLVVGLAVCVAYWPVLSGAESFYHLDRYGLAVPFWEFTWRAIQSGQSPAWTPDIRAGFPLLAYGPANQLYPLTYLFLPFFPAWRALDLFTLAHVAMLGVFTWLFLRQLTHNHLLALAGGVSFALSGRVSGLTIWADAVAALAYLPLLLWAVDRRTAWGMALAMGLGLLTGRPQVHLFTVLAGSAYAAFRLRQAWRTQGKVPTPVLLTSVAGFALGAALGAPQVLPTAALLADSDLGSGVDASYWQGHALGLGHLPSLLLPGSRPESWPEATAYPTLFVYLGLLALPALWLGKGAPGSRKAALFWLLLGGAALYFAAGGPGAHALSQALPGLRSVRVPARFALITSMAALVAATLAWSHLLAGRARWTAGLLALALLDGVVSTRTGRWSVWAGAYRQEPASVELVRAQSSDAGGAPLRFIAKGNWIWPRELAGRSEAEVDARFRQLPPFSNLAMRYGLRSADGYGEPTLRWQALPLDAPMLRQLGVGLLFLDRPIQSPFAQRVDAPETTGFVYRLGDPLPRARVVGGIRLAPSWEAAQEMSCRPDFEVERAAVLEEPQPSLEPIEHWSVRWEEEAPTHLALSVASSQAGYLLLADTWALGWRAQVNGEEADVWRANGRHRLVRIPAGTSRVEFDYSTPGLREGGGLFLVGLLGLVLLRLRERGFARDERQVPAAESHHALQPAATALTPR